MIKEVLKINTRKVKLKIERSKICSVYKATNQSTGVRLYGDKIIGIAGQLGNVDETALEKRAKDMLNFKVSYDCQPTKESVRTEDTRGKDISDKELVDTTNELLGRLSKHCPDYNFSESVTLTEVSCNLKNDCGTNLVHNERYVSMGLLIKHKDSLNMMDSYGSLLARECNVDDMFKSCTRFTDIYTNKVDIKDGLMPVVFTDNTLLGVFMRELNGKLFGAKATQLSNKVGQKVFSDSFSLSVDRNPKHFSSFFDGEGSTLKNDTFTLIENGVVKAPFTAKRIATKFGFENTASAHMVYDAVPDLSAPSFVIAHNGKTLEQTLGGRQAIIVDFAMGGNYTSQGEFSTPVQASYLYDGKKIVGRLPQISISSDMFKLFGDDFIGQTNESFVPGQLDKFCVFNMKVARIGDWT